VDEAIDNSFFYLFHAALLSFTRQYQCPNAVCAAAKAAAARKSSKKCGEGHEDCFLHFF
jgi:hypothetical protein